MDGEDLLGQVTYILYGCVSRDVTVNSSRGHGAADQGPDSCLPRNFCYKLHSLPEAYFLQVATMKLGVGDGAACR